MLRARLPKLLFVAGLVVANGCGTLSNNCLVSRPRPRPAVDCEWIDAGAVPFSEGTVIQDFPTYPAPTTALPVPGYQGPLPQPGVPPLTPTPDRLVPLPQGTAPIEPYTPGTTMKKIR